MRALGEAIAAERARGTSAMTRAASASERGGDPFPIGVDDTGDDRRIELASADGRYGEHPPMSVSATGSLRPSR